ncbi:type 2 isopentenyl-diphosphate Delta-isomerase [Euzebya sp.]|uniref:type 2 isopentenyl-diphosphate Delta-isomerase n=1 Tax=Euzebya sp. TaxID=1971409 RepID=UPI0035136288
MDDATARRKADHLRVALDEDVGHIGITTGLERLRLNARALPGRALDEVSTAVTAFGRELAAPLLVSCMTGGTSEAGRVNVALATAAQRHHVAVGLGSGRILLEGGDAGSFAVREVAPDVPLLANLGAVQLAEVGVDGCVELVDRTGADVLVLHLNPVQEAVQPGGDTDFGGVAERIAEVVAGVGVPVVAKEVGFGLAPADVAELLAAGVAGIDVAGAGGTNWATVEGHRDDRAGRVASAFAGWGWSTVESLRAAVAARTAGRPLTVIASGGLADGVDAVKCLALGADLAGFGRRLLPAAAEGPEPAAEALGVLVDQLRIATWAVGTESVTELHPSVLREVE